jgi:hypothetical protein
MRAEHGSDSRMRWRARRSRSGAETGVYAGSRRQGDGEQARRRGGSRSPGWRAGECRACGRCEQCCGVQWWSCGDGGGAVWVMRVRWAAGVGERVEAKQGAAAGGTRAAGPAALPSCPSDA